MAYALFHYLILLFLLPIYVVAQTNGNIAVGSSFTAINDASPWLSSPSGDFAFGFRQINQTDLFLLSIWYHKIPDQTIVWYANGDKPAPRDSKVELTADRGLVLANPEGAEMWRSDFSFGDIVAYGIMNDTGNFVLEDDNSKSLWESFNNPTDTMLPSQTMLRGGVLFSQRSDTNFSRGRFQFRLLDDGNLVLNSANLPTYFSYDAYYSSNTLDFGYQLIFNNSGYLYLRNESLNNWHERLDITKKMTLPAADYYHRVTLNFDGVLTQYSHPKASAGTWSAVWSLPDNICLAVGGLGSGACGFNSICTLNEYQRPRCVCPRGYSLLDPNDEYGSCKSDFVLGCEAVGQGSAENIYDFVEISNTDWPRSDYERLKPYNEEECKESCLHDCFCAVAIFGTEGPDSSCWKKKLPLSNGRENRSTNRKAFIKVAKDHNSPQTPHLPKPGTKRNQDTLIITGSVLLGSSVFVNFVLIGTFCLGFFFIYRKKLIRNCSGKLTTETNLRCFTYEELEEATNGFQDELGRGSFGVVYRGVIKMASTNIVAVKKLVGVVQDREKEFKTELDVIGKIHHKNLVRLLGFCDEGNHRLLVYEFMSNGNLASFIFGDSKLSWIQRIHIACGVARGLLYLHEECSTQIIHCDIKPQNILLDDYYNARISDLGLAKLLMMDRSHTNTVIRGTRGYVAPDWFKNKPINTKVDVYSFGVLLLEIICCRKSTDLEMGVGEKTSLTDWASDCYQEGRVDALVEDDMEALNDMRMLERLVMVAIWCIQEDPYLRPSMRQVTHMLEGVVEVKVPPFPYPSSSIG